MRRKDGRMSKKDLRALRAFGVTPQQDIDDATWTAPYLTMTNANTISVDISPSSGNTGAMWFNVQNGNLAVSNGQTWVVTHQVTWTR